ncbi:MAG: tetratricopeptide repeat protein [Rhodoferax sp.]|nr:tetratricopeptide repeat protein [Rhodoferax sp.]
MTISNCFKPSVVLLGLALCVPLAGAQNAAPQAPSSAVPSPQSALPQSALPKSALSSALLFQLLVAEFSQQNGDLDAAFQLMLDAAQKSRSEQLFERAVEIALAARAGDSALQAAQAWSKALPNSRNAYRYLLQLLIGLNKLDDTVAPIQRQLAALPSIERAAAITQLPRYFVRANDKLQASATLEQALRPHTGDAINGPAAYAAIGTMRLIAGNSAGALEAASKGAALNPQAEEPLQLALALVHPKLPEAEALVRRQIAGGVSADLRLAYVRKLIEAQRYAEALTEATAINRSQPDFADAWLLRGTLALQAHKTADAQSALRTFVKVHQSSNAKPAVAADAADAANAADAARTTPPQDRALVQAYLLLADAAEQSRQFDEAQRYLLLIDSPADALRIAIRQASLLARQGKLDQARQLVQNAPETEPEDARTKLSAEVQLLQSSKQFRAAYDLMQKTVQSNPDDADYLYDLAMAAEKLNRLQEMEKLLRQVIAAKPEHPHAYNALGYSLADRGLRLPEARALIQKALEFAPNDPAILDSMGWVEFRSGRPKEALPLLQQAWQSTQDGDIAAHLGEVLWVLQQKQEARAIWKQALQQNPDNDTLQQTLKRLRVP